MSMNRTNNLKDNDKSDLMAHDAEISRAIKNTASVPDDELAVLLRTTNYSKREIIDFYTRKDLNDANDDGVIDFEEFGELCKKAGLVHKELVKMLWTFFDEDHSTRVTKFEMVEAIAPITRGTTEDLARMFFHFYDAEKVWNRTTRILARVLICSSP